MLCQILPGSELLFTRGAFEHSGVRRCVSMLLHGALTAEGLIAFSTCVRLTRIRALGASMIFQRSFGGELLGADGALVGHGGELWGG